MIIAMEGLEGVGKTTLSELISQKCYFDYLKTPTPSLNPVRESVANWNSDQARFYFYLSAIFLVQPQLCVFKGSLDQHVLIDRYIASTIAYHAKGRHFSPPLFESSDVQEPDLTINVTCPSHIRESRLGDRGFHIFERPEFKNENIADYFKDVSDIEYANTATLAKSTNELSNILSSWLSKQE